MNESKPNTIGVDPSLGPDRSSYLLHIPMGTFRDIDEFALSLIYADNGEPITGEWLESVGFKEDVSIRAYASYKIHPTPYVTYHVRNFAGFDWVVDDGHGQRVLLAALTKRGELRMLMRLLGVKLVPRGTNPQSSIGDKK